MDVRQFKLDRISRSDYRKRNGTPKHEFCPIDLFYHLTEQMMFVYGLAFELFIQDWRSFTLERIPSWLI